MAGAFKLVNGSILLSTEAPGGIYNSQQLNAIANLAADGADSILIKVTEDQRLALFVPEESVDSIVEELQKTGLGVRHYQRGLHQPTTCIGELCPEHCQDALGSAVGLSEALAEMVVDSPLKIGINGCSQCCVPTHTLDISIIGDDAGYKINLGGKNSLLPEMATFMAEGVPAEKLTELVQKIIALFNEHRQEDESLQDLMERAGTSMFSDALMPYSQDAAGGGDPFGAFAVEDDENIGTDDIEDESELAEMDDIEGLVDEDSDVELDDELDALGDDIDTLGDTVGTIDEDDTEAEFDLDSELEAEEETLADSAKEELGGMDDLTAEADEMSLDDIDIDPNEFEDEVSELAGDVPITADSGETAEEDTMLAPAEDFAMEADDDMADLAPEELEEPVEMEIGLDEDEELVDTDTEPVSEEDEDAFEEKLNKELDETADLEPVTDENEGSRDEALRLLEADPLDELDDDILENSVSSDSAPTVATERWTLASFSQNTDGSLDVGFGNGASLTIDMSQVAESISLQVGEQTLEAKKTASGLQLSYGGMSLKLPPKVA